MYKINTFLGKFLLKNQIYEFYSENKILDKISFEKMFCRIGRFVTENLNHTKYFFNLLLVF